MIQNKETKRKGKDLTSREKEKEREREREGERDHWWTTPELNLERERWSSGVEIRRVYENTCTVM